MEDQKKISSAATKMSVLTCAAWLVGSVGTAMAQPGTDKADLTPSALEQYRDMSAEERAELANEAAAISATPIRKATSGERDMLGESPAQARKAIKEDFSKRGGLTGKEFRSGTSVGKVVGSAFLTSRTVTITADGKHLQSCGTADHQHDAKTSALISKMTKSQKTQGGAAHE